ncbi:MAG: hypothetical protein QM790_07900 [Nibricoccus sp.]
MDLKAARTLLAHPLHTTEICVLSTIESWLINCDQLFVSHRRSIVVEIEEIDVAVLLLRATNQETELVLATRFVNDVRKQADRFMLAAVKSRLDAMILEQRTSCVVWQAVRIEGEFSIREFRPLFNQFVACASLSAEPAA